MQKMEKLADATVNLTEEQINARRDYLQNALSFFKEKTKGNLSTYTRIKAAKEFMKPLLNQDFTKIFDKQGLLKESIDKAVTIQKSAFEGALNSAAKKNEWLRHTLSMATEKPPSQKWTDKFHMNKLSARVEEKLIRGNPAKAFVRQSAVGLGLVFALSGLSGALVPKNEIVLNKDNTLEQRGSKADRMRNLFTLATGVGVAVGAALI